MSKQIRADEWPQSILRMEIQDAREQMEEGLLKAEAMLEKAKLPPAYLHRGVYGLPGGDPHPSRRFDVNRLLMMFPLLHLEEDYEIDYIYHNDGIGGGPQLYTRSKEEAFPSVIETSQPSKKDEPRIFLPHLTFDPSPLGYLQFVLFSELSNQFYLFWHAGYHDDRFILSRARALNILKGLEPDKQTESMADWLEQIDFTPRLEIYSNGTARLLAVIFTLWGGFERRAWELRAPASILAQDTPMNLIPYNCGIVF